jgi:hypothetical protein
MCGVACRTLAEYDPAGRTRQEGNVTELPIIVEAHAWLDVGFGVLMLLVTYVLVRGTFDPLDTNDDVSKVIVGVLAALFTFGLGISLLVRDLNWQFRLEEKGIVLHAPFDYMHPSAEIGWSEITSMSVIEHSYRGGGRGWRLHIHGKPGREIVLHTIDRLPAQFGMGLQKLVSERAPQAKGGRTIAEDFNDARRHPAFLAAGYSVRNGRGALLR